MPMNLFPRVSKMIHTSDDPSWIQSLSCQRRACRDMPLDNDDTLHNTSLYCDARDLLDLAKGQSRFTDYFTGAIVAPDP
jgi:hypothetical protein